MTNKEFPENIPPIFLNKKNRPARLSSTEMARNQTYADWLGTSLPIDEKKNIKLLSNLLVQALQEIDFREPEITPTQLRVGWNRAAGEFIANQAELIKIDKKTAVIKVIHPSLRFHLNQWKDPLLHKLQKEFGSDLIAYVKFIFG